MRCAGDRQAGYNHPLASRGFQSVLALEVETLWWPTNCTAGDTQAYPRDEHCQPAVGSAAAPWRVAHKIGIEIGQTNVAKYMVKRREPPSQGWKTFLRNHTGGVAGIDL